MVYSSLGKKSISIMTAMAFAISGCMPSDVPSARQNFNATPVGSSTSGAGAGATTTGTGSGALTSLPPKVEIRHLIEPNLSTDTSYSSGTGYAGGGSYVRKLTLPKNFQGKLYLAGINIAALADRHVKVRFKFGLGREPITIPATVAQAPGITPQTNIHVLVMDMRSEPFRNVRLTYDLFDYNEYTSTSSPVQDNRDTGLYCRGLKLEDDPTFTGIGACDGLEPDEECLYAYAKILDQGLVKETSPSVYVPLTPTLPQVKSFSGSSYYEDFMDQHLKKALGDNADGPFIFSKLAVPDDFTDAKDLDFLTSTSAMDWGPLSINGSTYYYRGPYRLINMPEWQFGFKDPLNAGKSPVGDKRLFRNLKYYNGSVGPTPETSFVYYESFLFPLATKIDLTSNVTHLSSEKWDEKREERTLPTAGKTLWMDGSNARVSSRNSDQEHIGSCNVTATLEIIAKDDNSNEYIIAESKDVKLQLVRPIQHFTDTGNDVLYSNFKTCASNASCGGNECCFNNRCWDQTLVSQCYDSTSTQGNKPIGESCTTDMDCTSLCCNRTSGLCAPHNSVDTPAVLCSKPIGDFCIAKEWCQKTPVVKCLIVKTGTNALGDVTCRQQCYTTSEYGECKAGVCTAPFQEVIPVFDPNAPGACNNAVPAPNF